MRFAAAVHEAAHAAVATALGLHVIEVTLDGTGGDCWLDHSMEYHDERRGRASESFRLQGPPTGKPDWPNLARALQLSDERLIEIAAYVIAGKLAEDEFHFAPPSPVDLGIEESLYECLQECPHGRARFRARSLAASLLAEHRGSVSLLSLELYLRARLEGDQVREIMRSGRPLPEVAAAF